MFDYNEFLASIDRAAYHEGEWQWEEEGYTVTRTYNYSAPGCHDSCGVLLYTKDGKLAKIEGDPLDPCTNGKLCMRCLDLVEATNHPDRLKYPMLRAGERGENKWDRISWDEAFDLVAEKIKEIDDAGFGRESILLCHGTGRNINWQMPFLASACLGTPNIGAFFFSGFSCYLPRVCGAMAPMGDYPVADCSHTHRDRYANENYEFPEAIVVWGNEPLKSNGDGFIGHWLLPLVQHGAKIISIDPVLTWWGARAEYWLPLRPGTDEALALAWCHVITQEDLIDHDFVDKWCAYYPEFADYVSRFTPEWAAEICGLDPEAIRGSARLYASSHPATIQWGLAFDTQVSSMELCLTACDLMAICGNVDRPGTEVLLHNSFEINAGYSVAELYCDPETWKKRLTTKYCGMTEGEEFIAMACSDCITAAVESEQPYPFKMAWLESTNPLSCDGLAAPRAYNALRMIPFVVYADPFITPTAVACADLLLPVAMSPERDSARTWWTPLRAMKKVISFYEAKSDEELILALGKRLNPELFANWNTVEDFINTYLHTDLAVVDENGRVKKTNFTTVADNADAGVDRALDSESVYSLYHGRGDFKSLVESGGCDYDEWNDTYEKFEKGMLRPDGKPGFNTPSGRIELIPSLYPIWGIEPYPTHKESFQGEKWLQDPEFREEYPLVFISGARSYEFFHSEHRQLPTMREFHPVPLVKMSPNTAEKYGISDGDWVWLEGVDGRCKQKAKIFPGIDDKFVSAEHGWWFPETEGAEPNLFGTFDCNPNNLTHIFEYGSHGVGNPVKNLYCKIYKVEEGDTLPGEQVTRLGGFRNDYEAWKM